MLRQALAVTDPALFSAAVGLWQRMLLAIPADQPGEAVMLSNLGTALQARFHDSCLRGAHAAA